jgi:hypothetical protein
LEISCGKRIFVWDLDYGVDRKCHHHLQKNRFVGPAHSSHFKGYRAELEFKSKPLFGGEYNVLAAKIKHEKETLYTITGKWDSKLEIRDNKSKSSEILWQPTRNTVYRLHAHAANSRNYQPQVAKI